MAVVTISEHHRKQGNQFYVSATDNLSPIIQKDRLTKATSFYYKAWNTALNNKERASASKNYGLSSWRLGKLTRLTTSDLELTKYYFIDALSYMIKAEKCGRKDGNSVVWLQEVNDHIDTILSDAKESFLSKEHGIALKVTFITQLIESLGDNISRKSTLYLEISELYFKDGVCFLANGDFKKALNSMCECYQPIEEAKRNFTFDVTYNVLIQEISEMEDDVFTHKCIAESMQMKEKGDSIIAQVIKKEENLNVTLVYDAMDCYRQSIILTRERDIENEAIAHSRLGGVYHDIMKIPNKAKEYYLRAIELAHTLQPRNFNTDPWFMKAKQVVEMYQKKADEESRSLYEESRKEFISAQTDELEKIKKASEKDAVVFLEYLYKTHPPKDKAHTMEKKPTEMTSEFKKKALVKAILHYHPDKQNAQAHGMLWKVLCEEITKYLNVKYEYFKD